MKMDTARRFTTAHQSLTFSRRMMLLGGAQAAEPGQEEPGDLAREVDERRDDGADLDHRGVGRDRRVVHGKTEELLGDGEVSG